MTRKLEQSDAGGLSRRDFLKVGAVAGGAVIMAACMPDQTPSSEIIAGKPTVKIPTPKPRETHVPTEPASLDEAILSPLEGRDLWLVLDDFEASPVKFSNGVEIVKQDPGNLRDVTVLGAIKVDLEGMDDNLAIVTVPGGALRMAQKVGDSWCVMEEVTANVEPAGSGINNYMQFFLGDPVTREYPVAQSLEAPPEVLPVFVRQYQNGDYMGDFYHDIRGGQDKWYQIRPQGVGGKMTSLTEFMAPWYVSGQAKMHELTQAVKPNFVWVEDSSMGVMRIAISEDGTEQGVKWVYDENAKNWVGYEKQVLPDGLDWESIESSRLPIPREFYLNGVLTTVRMGRDSSIQSLIKTWNLHLNGWKTDSGHDATEALPAFTQQAFYDVWKERQTQLDTGLANTDLGTWLIWVKNAQESGRAEDWAKVSVDIWANDATTPHQLEKIRVAPFFRQGGQLPDGVRGVTEVDFVMCRNNNRLTSLENGGGGGITVDLRPNGKLVCIISPSSFASDTFSSYSMIKFMAGIKHFLGAKGVKDSVNVELLKYLGRASTSYHGSSFIQIEPASEVEKYYNR